MVAGAMITPFPGAAPPPKPPVISVRDLTKSFGDRKVLNGVNLDVNAAENVVVLGRSGSGKSVLVKILVGLLKPDSGSVHLFGQDVLAATLPELNVLRRRVGFSFQSGALYDSMTVGENLAFPLTMGRVKLAPGELGERVEAALSAVSLSGAVDQMPSELSGGQRKRVGIARTLILRPEIMLYDEPTAGLDPVTSAEINELILKVQQDFHTASIIITHDLTCARTVGQRMAMLIEGAVLKVGSFDEVFASDDPRIAKFYEYNFSAPRSP